MLHSLRFVLSAVCATLSTDRQTRGAAEEALSSSAEGERKVSREHPAVVEWPWATAPTVDASDASGEPPNATALERLFAAISDGFELNERLRAMDTTNPDAISEAEWRCIEDIARGAVSARNRLVAAARELGMDVDA